MAPASEAKLDSKAKAVRRSILEELVARQVGLLATDYPTEDGRKFISKVQREHPALEITLVNKGHFKRDTKYDSLPKEIKKLRKDIFDVLPYHWAPIVDIDLYGGLSTVAVERIETSTHWKKLYLTFTKAFRHKKLKGAIPATMDPATYIELWSKRNGWTATQTQLPYRHPNKNAILGVIDNRGPKYWTFLIERP